MFEWNEQKAARNAREHKGVTFEEAATIFNDPDVYIEDDAGHSDEEDRFVALGVSEKLRMLFCLFHLSRRKHQAHFRAQGYTARKETL
jgi:uncharacterized DUF497 family protein